MKTKATRSIQSYLKQVKPYLADCPFKTRRQLLSGLSQELEEYAAQHPTISLEELSACFRLPEETAQELLLAVPLPVQAASRQLKLLMHTAVSPGLSPGLSMITALQNQFSFYCKSAQRALFFFL